MSKKNRKNAETAPETPDTTAAAAVEVDAQTQSALDRLAEKEKVYTTEVDQLTLQLSELKGKLRKIHTIRKQLQSVLGIEEPAATPAEPTPAEG